MSSSHDPFFEQAPRGSSGRRSPLQVAPALKDTIEPSGSEQAPAETVRVGDPLLQCMAWLTAFHGKPRSPESLRADQQIDGQVTPDQALRVLREAGYNAGLLPKRLPEVNPLLLPAILLLEQDDACVLVRRLETEQGARYEVVFPDGEGQPAQASEQELAAAFSGFLLVATPKLDTQSEGRADRLLAEEGRHWFWGTVMRFVPYYRASLLAAFLSNVLLLAIGLVTAVIFDKVIPNQSMVTLWTLAVGAGIALCFDLFARQLRSHLIDLAGRKTDLIIGSKLFRQTLGVRMEHRPESAGAYGFQLGQIETIRDFFASASMSAVSDLPFIVVFVAVTFVVAGPLGWVLALAVPLLFGVTWLTQLRQRRVQELQVQEQADLHGTLVEALEGLEDLKTSGAQGRFIRRYETATAVAAEASLRSRTLSAFSNNLTMTAQQLITLVMLVWGVYLIKDGQLTQGALVGAMMFSGRAIAPLSMVVSLAARYQGARACMEALNKLMEKPQERDPRRAYVPLKAVKGQLALNDVGFHYPLPSGVEGNAPKVLKAVGLKFEPGERVAVLGRIGSGKSTILRLLAGLYQPCEGAVELDGIDLRQIDPAEYRARMGFVSQEPRLFNGSLRDNVTMGRGSVDASRLAAVARLTGLERVVAAHPQGWDLNVGEMGGQLSGGQRQLVALARALVHQPQVLLMDEPTSSMDAQSELQFLRQLKEALAQSKAMLIVVTHRPAVLELVQRIVVIDGGKVVMDGPRDAVLAALSGARPPGGEASDAQKVRIHPTAQPVARSSTL